MKTRKNYSTINKMNWLIIGLFVAVIILVTYIVTRPPKIEVIVEEGENEDKNKSYHDWIVDNIIDYRFYTPWAHYGYRQPYFQRVGGSPYRYRWGGRRWGGRRHGGGRIGRSGGRGRK